MKFLTAPQLPVIDITSLPAGSEGRLVINSTDNFFYYDNGTAWVSLGSAGGASITVSDTPPTPPQSGSALWWCSLDGVLRIYFQQAQAWIDAVTGTVGPQGPSGPTGATGATGIQGPIGESSGPVLAQSPSVTTASVRWLPYAVGGGNLTTISVTANRNYYVAFNVGVPTTITRLIVSVTTAATVTAYLGLYQDNGSGLPGNLLASGTVLNITATGDQISTIASTTLQPGITYYLFLACSAAVTIRAAAVGSIYSAYGYVANNTTQINFIYRTLTAAAPASVAPTSGYTSGTGTTPVIFIAP